MKKFLKYFLMIAPILMILAVYSKLPAEVPMHWNIQGEIDRYGSKNELFLLAGLNIFLGAFMSVIAKIDPKQKNYEKFRETYDWIMICTLGFMTAIIAVILVETMQPGTMDISKAICIMVGALFIVLGSMMAKIKQNFFTGIKTPWTLSSEAVWDKTQKLGGKCLVLGGILIMGSALLSSGEAAVFMIILVAVLVTVAPLVMSYIWYKKEMEK